MLLLEYVWHHFRCLAKRLATQHCAKITWRCAHQNQSNKNPQPTLHSLIIGWLCSRAAQNFWSLMLQTPNWKLVQTVKLCQVSSPSEVFLPRPQRLEDVWPTYKDGLWWSFSGCCGRGKKPSDIPSQFGAISSLEFEARDPKKFGQPYCVVLHGFYQRKSRLR